MSLAIVVLWLESKLLYVPHKLLWYSLRKSEVPQQYVDFIKSNYMKATSIVRCPASVYKQRQVTISVYQGSTLSPQLFNICMNAITRDLQKPHL